MRYKYCPECGSKLVLREIGDEGLIPFCEQCSQPWFDIFASCVIVLVADEQDRVALLHQDYLSTRYCNLVTGYMKPGETAEESAEREVLEETGIALSELRLVGTYWFRPKGILMIAFIGRAKNTDFRLSCEVNGAEWATAEEALHKVFPKAPGNASYALVEKFLEETQTKRRMKS